jgi:hypothetical protein
MQKFPLTTAIEHRTDGISALVFYIDYSAGVNVSFRALLETIEKTLGETGTASIELPPYQSSEDFIDGILLWRSTRYEIYYEYALGYVQFECTNPSDITALEAALSSIH